MIDFSDNQFAGELRVGRFLIFNDQFFSFDGGDGQHPQFRIVEVVERAPHVGLVAVVEEQFRPFGHMIRTEKEVQRKCALRANPQPPDPCPVGEGEADAAVRGRVVRHEFIGKTIAVTKVRCFQRVDTQLFFQVE